MKAKMMGPVVCVGEIYLHSSSGSSFHIFLEVHDHYRLGHPAVLHEEVLVGVGDPLEHSHHLHLMMVPSLKVEDCWMELHMQAVMCWEIPDLGHKILFVSEFPP